MPTGLAAGLRIAAAVSVLAAASGVAHAESLADAVALAYQTNPTLQAQRSQLRITDEGYVQARAGYRPTANATAGAGWQWTHLGSGRCSVFDCRTETNNFSANLTVSQPLFTSGRASSRVRGAEADVLAGREQLRQTENQVMLQVVRAYVDVRRDEQSLQIRRDNVAVLQRQVDESRARFNVGEITRTDVAQSEAQLAQAQSQLAGAQAQLGVSRANYAAIVGQNPATLDPEPAFQVFPATVEQAFDTAMQNNPAVRAADYGEQSADAALAEARAQRLPNVSLQGQMGYNQLLHPWDSTLSTHSYSAGVTVSQPLFAGGALASQVRQAVERRNIYRIQYEQARRTATQDISQDWNLLLAARSAIVAGQEQVRAARVAFDGARAEQQVGLRTTLEMLTAQQVLRDAELSLVNARHDEYVASASVLGVMGLLEARTLAPGLTVEPGGHSFAELRRAPGYVPGVEDVVGAVDSIVAPHIERAPAPVDAPISTDR